MTRSFMRVFLILGIAWGVISPAAVFAQSSRKEAVNRSSRLRAHEERIKKMIEERREEARRKQQEKALEEAQQPQGEEEVEEEAATRDTRAVSSAVLGFKFIDEQGVADYNIITHEGSTFLSEVTLFNIDSNPIDEIRLALDFDKRFIEPVKIFDTALRNTIVGEPKFQLDEREAIINYRAELANPLRNPEVVLLRILWRANRQTSFTGIEFAFDEFEQEDTAHTAVYVQDRNILGVRDDPADGVLSGGLMIDPPPETEPILQGKGEELKDLYLGSVASDHMVGLALVGPKETPEVGEEFIVRVALNNPDGALIDALDLSLEFDPDVLQVVDDDKFNTIRRGVNINDGIYTEFFPWDMHKRNEVRNEWGMINYQMSLSNGEALPTRAFARIRFRAVAPASETFLTIRKGNLSQISRTSIRYFGYERLDLTREYSRPALRLVLPASQAPVVAEAEESANQSEAKQGEELRVRELKIER